MVLSSIFKYSDNITNPDLKIKWNLKHFIDLRVDLFYLSRHHSLWKETFMNNKLFNIPVELLILVLISVAVVLAFNVNKPFQLDEAYPFAYNAHVFNESGIKTLGERTSEGAEETVLEIAHPPLYPVMLSLFFKLFGETDAAGRLFGIFCLGLTLLVLREISKILYPENAGTAWLTTGILLLLSPFILQFSLLLDIDNTILTPCLLLTIFWIIRLIQSGERTNLVWAGLSLGLAFWAKELSPPVIPAALAIFYLLKKEWKKAILDPLIIAGIGLAFFGVTWLLFCAWTDIPPLVFIKFLLSRKGDFFFNFTYVNTIIYVFKLLVAWLSPAFILLVILWTVHLIRSRKTQPFVDAQGFAIVWILIMSLYTLIYIPLTTNLPLLKYAFPLFPLLFLLIGGWLSRQLGTLSFKERGLLYLSGGIAALFFFLLIKNDPLSAAYGNRLSFTGSTFIFLWLPALGLPIFSMILLKKKSIGSGLAIGLLSVLLGFDIFLNVRQTADGNTAPSWDKYGEKGLRETVDYLSAETETGGEIAARKDIGYYLNFRENRADIAWLYPLFRGVRSQCEKDFSIIEHSSVQFVVLDQLTNQKTASEIISPLFFLDKTFGNFYIYRRLSDKADIVDQTK